MENNSPTQPVQKNNNKVLYISLGIAALVVVLIGTAGFFIFGFLKDGATKITNNIANSSSSNYSTASELFNSNLSLECTTTEGGKSEKVYIKQGSVTGGTEGNKFVLNPKGMYIWEEGKKDGFFYDIKANDIFKTSSPMNSGMMDGGMMNNFLIDQNFDDFKKSCVTASLEDSMFEIPKDVNFQSISDLLKANGITSTTIDTPANNVAPATDYFKDYQMDGGN